MKEIIKGLYYDNKKECFNGEELNIHITRYQPLINPDLTLLISKVSEAVYPNTIGNHIGEGDNLDNFLIKQKGVRFIINGGFSHYRKNFYEWKHQSFNVGDPVGIVKIRDHFFEDYIHLDYYGFLIQKEKGELWEIQQKEHITKNEKYILGCTPLLIFKKERIMLSADMMTPMEQGIINPPSILAHGLQQHPRTAIGLKDNDLYFITVEGGTFHYKGCTLLDLQNIGLSLELDSFLNLDGGGSSQFKLMTDNMTIENDISPEDKNRILGHVLVIFDKKLK